MIFEKDQPKVNRSLFCDATAELLVAVARIVYFLRSAKIHQAETLQAGRSLDWPLVSFPCCHKMFRAANDPRSHLT